MITRADIALIISLGATAAAVASAAFSYWTFRESNLPPEIFARLDKIEVHTESETVLADVEFSVSNRSSREITIIHCAFLTDRLNSSGGDGGYYGGGGGGYNTQPSPCDFKEKEFNENDPLIIAPGQTRFFSAAYSQMSDYDFEFFLGGMGIKLSELAMPEDDRSCFVSFGVRHNDSSVSQSCNILQGFDSRSIAFNLILQSGTGENYSTPIEITTSPDWPWSYGRD